MVIRSKERDKMRMGSRGYNDIKESDTGSASPIFDVISQTWTKPIPNYLTEMYLKRMVFVCSCCIYSSGAIGDIVNHHKLVKDESYSHKTAEIKDIQSDNGIIFSCTGCPAKFTTRTKAENHLDFKKQSSKVHVNPTVLDLKQYSLEPRPSHLSEVEDHNSVDSTPLDRPRKRRRNRRRKR